ncbi:MAG: Pyruvate ferredoxin oxidoreductase, alpha subunit [Methanoculleus marisnigri]|uniref:Pyruvate ferredoxin oxidoreductase, alpha subunit n=2 Tax=Methanoculleus marisnigri TaxID=2198 RepID=A0A101IQT2_9EURY|nr:MAG: Pyruvate ferredoxin oxidoreductase, alpha subunit [Methanoculleus marisnigri]
MLEFMEGSHAVAEIVKRCRPQVIAAYPITPQTHIVEDLAQMVANCEIDAEYITVESEFSALSACLGASAAGSRVYSATTSQGLALMFEVCFNAAGMRQPIVMTVANRSLGAPLSIWNDQQDSISLRDSGWLQFYAEDNQEAADLHMIAYRVCEDHDILLPAFVCFDGFILTHTSYQRLDAANPLSMGMYATPEYYMEFRYEIDRAMHRSKQAFIKAGREFGEQFGRDYSALVEGYRLEDADTALVAMGSICGTAKDAIDEMREHGRKVGLLKIRTYRPFPAPEIVDALKGVSTVAVLDKNISLGNGGAVGTEVKSALYGSSQAVYDYIIALGGRDVRKRDIAAVVDLAEKGEGDLFYGLRTEVL